jgi:hypothetical protein
MQHNSQGGGKGMYTGKQALAKPQKKVGVPLKKGRSKEGKGGKPAVPGRRTCGELAAPPDQQNVGIAWSVETGPRSS